MSEDLINKLENLKEHILDVSIKMSQKPSVEVLDHAVGLYGFSQIVQKWIDGLKKEMQND